MSSMNLGSRVIFASCVVGTCNILCGFELFNGRGSILLFTKYVDYNIIITIHSSCEIEDFVETHLCKLCVILQSRVSQVVCPH